MMRGVTLVVFFTLAEGTLIKLGSQPCSSKNTLQECYIREWIYTQPAHATNRVRRNDAVLTYHHAYDNADQPFYILNDDTLTPVRLAPRDRADLEALIGPFMTPQKVVFDQQLLDALETEATEATDAPTEEVTVPFVTDVTDAVKTTTKKAATKKTTKAATKKSVTMLASQLQTTTSKPKTTTTKAKETTPKSKTTTTASKAKETTPTKSKTTAKKTTPKSKTTTTAPSKVKKTTSKTAATSKAAATSKETAAAAAAAAAAATSKETALKAPENLPFNPRDAYAQIQAAKADILIKESVDISSDRSTISVAEDDFKLEVMAENSNLILEPSETDFTITAEKPRISIHPADDITAKIDTDKATVVVTPPQNEKDCTRIEIDCPSSSGIVIETTDGAKVEANTDGPNSVDIECSSNVKKGEEEIRVNLADKVTIEIVTASSTATLNLESSGSVKIQFAGRVFSATGTDRAISFTVDGYEVRFSAKDEPISITLRDKSMVSIESDTAAVAIDLAKSEINAVAGDMSVVEIRPNAAAVSVKDPSKKQQQTSSAYKAIKVASNVLDMQFNVKEKLLAIKLKEVKALLQSIIDVGVETDTLELVVDGGDPRITVYAGMTVVDMIPIGGGKGTTKAPAKKTTKAPAKKTTKAPAKKTTKAPAKKTTNAPAKKTTKAPSKITTKAPAKATTKAPAKKTTKTPSKSTTKAPAKATTKSPSKTTTKAPSKPTTKATSKTTAVAKTTPKPSPTTTQATFYSANQAPNSFRPDSQILEKPGSVGIRDDAVPLHTSGGGATSIDTYAAPAVSQICKCDERNPARLLARNEKLQQKLREQRIDLKVLREHTRQTALSSRFAATASRDEPQNPRLLELEREISRRLSAPQPSQDPKKAFARLLQTPIGFGSSSELLPFIPDEKYLLEMSLRVSKDARSNDAQFASNLRLGLAAVYKRAVDRQLGVTQRARRQTQERFDVQITNLDRKASTRLIVRFVVETVSGNYVPAARAEDTYAQLSAAEISAVLGLAVIESPHVVTASTAIEEIPHERDTWMMIVIGVCAAIIVLVALATAFYFWRNSKGAKNKHDNSRSHEYPQLGHRIKPTESRASHSRHSVGTSQAPSLLYSPDEYKSWRGGDRDHRRDSRDVSVSSFAMMREPQIEESPRRHSSVGRRDRIREQNTGQSCQNTVTPVLPVVPMARIARKRKGTSKDERIDSMKSPKVTSSVQNIQESYHRRSVADPVFLQHPSYYGGGHVSKNNLLAPQVMAQQYKSSRQQRTRRQL